LILILSNDTLSSNNAFEQYREKGLEIPPFVEDSLYRFEGYKIYQLAGPDVGLSEVDNIDQARLVIQVDVKNGVNTIYNWTSIPNPDPNNSEVIWVPEQKVQGADQGIRHTFNILEDQFGSDDRRLVNHRKYYYTAVAYGYNNYELFDPRDVVGQRTPYLEGRLNIQTYAPIPRPITFANLNSFYGEGATITGLGGVGAGGNELDITDETREAIVANGSVSEIDYLPGAAPIEVKVFDPLRVKNGSYILEFSDKGDGQELRPDARWRMYPENDPDDVTVSDRTIAIAYEQIISGRGFSVRIGQTDDVGDRADETNGTLGLALEYDDVSGPQWFTAVPDGAEPFDFVKTECPDGCDCGLDLPNQPLSSMGGGTFVPYQICDYRPNQLPCQQTVSYMASPAWINVQQANVRNSPIAAIQNLNNVDLVFTSDKSKWSRCVVVETSNGYHTDLGVETEGGSRNFDIRNVPSVGKEDNDGDGKADPDGEVDNSGNPLMGYGWFPGYAVDVETGKRLNVFFGEASIYTSELSQVFPGYPENGNDMIWNPSSDVFVSSGQFPPFATDFAMGGMHYVYVTGQEYDGCAEWGQNLRPGGDFFKLRVLPNITWTAMPILAPETELLSYNDGLIPNELTIKMRVDNPYETTEDEDGNPVYPKYRIVFEDVEPGQLADGEVNEALDAINVVPNPYYAYSTYEVSQFSNVVKITNLPAECDITIFSIDGRFIRQYKRNEVGILTSPPRANPPFDQTQIVPDLEWDLRNHAGIPIASGVYLIHVNAPGLGERVIKWFGVSRKFDPSGL